MSDHHSTAGSAAYRVAALGLLGFSFAYGIAASRIEYSFSSDPLGPRVFPVLLAGILGVLSLLALLRPSGSGPWPRGELLIRSVALVAVLIGSTLLFEPLGFGAAMFILTVGVGRIFGASWGAALLGGVIQAALWWFIFGYLLEVYLPVGDVFAALRR